MCSNLTQISTLVSIKCNEQSQFDGFMLFKEPIMDLPSVLPHVTLQAGDEVGLIQSGSMDSFKRMKLESSICFRYTRDIKKMETSERESIWSRITVNWRGHAWQRGAPIRQREFSQTCWDNWSSVITSAASTCTEHFTHSHCLRYDKETHIHIFRKVS